MPRPERGLSSPAYTVYFGFQEYLAYNKMKHTLSVFVPGAPAEKAVPPRASASAEAQPETERALGEFPAHPSCFLLRAASLESQFLRLRPLDHPPLASCLLAWPTSPDSGQPETPPFDRKFLAQQLNVAEDAHSRKL